MRANSQGSFGKGLPRDALDEPDGKAFDFEIVARAGRKDIKDTVPRLVLVGFEDIDNNKTYKVTFKLVNMLALILFE